MRDLDITGFVHFLQMKMKMQQPQGIMIEAFPIFFILEIFFLENVSLKNFLARGGRWSQGGECPPRRQVAKYGEWSRAVSVPQGNKCPRAASAPGWRVVPGRQVAKCGEWPRAASGPGGRMAQGHEWSRVVSGPGHTGGRGTPKIRLCFPYFLVLKAKSL